MVFRGIYLFLIVFLTNCSSLLYYPSHLQYVDPHKLDLHPEEVVFYTEDNLLLNGWYFSSTKPKGLILLFHGNAQNITSHFLSLAWIIEFNYDLFIFDYRGYGRSQGEPTPKGTVLDGIAAINWSSQKAKSKNIPLIIYGQSIGGSISLQSYLMSKNRPKAATIIVESSFSSYIDAGNSTLSQHWLTYPFQFLANIFLSDDHAPLNKIKDISPTPILVIHGDNDKIVDIELGKRIFDLAAPPKKLWVIKGGGHINTYWKRGEIYRPKLLKYLDNIIQSN